jgi:hypothetical protein
MKAEQTPETHLVQLMMAGQAKICCEIKQKEETSKCSRFLSSCTWMDKNQNSIQTTTEISAKLISILR